MGGTVKRLVLLLFVATLATSISGTLDLAVPEPCPLGESSNSQDDQDCAATCVRCTCCAQSIEVLSAQPVFIALRISTELLSAFEFVPTDDPSDILHVPKRLAI